MRNDLDSYLPQESPCFESGEIRLWFRVFLDAFLAVRDGGGDQGVAWVWLTDPGNQFLESLAEHFDYTPEAFRQKVRQALGRTCSIPEKARQDRLRAEVVRTDSR